MLDNLKTQIDVESPPNLPLSFYLFYCIIYEAFNGGKIF